MDGEVVLKRKETGTHWKSYYPAALFKFNYYCFLSGDVCFLGEPVEFSCFVWLQ
jgi:hypothetical protein